MTKKQNGNCVLWFSGLYSQLNVGNFLTAFSPHCCVHIKYRFFRTLFIHKLQFLPPFWCLNVDICRSQSAIWCSSCIFNVCRDMRAAKLSLIAAKSHLHLSAAPVPSTVEGPGPRLNKGDVAMKSAPQCSLFYLPKRWFTYSYFAAGGFQKEQISLKDH